MERPITIRFTEERILGFDGCNQFGANYEVIRGRLRVGRIVSTTIGCSAAVMRTADRLFGLLDGGTVTNRAGELTLTGRGVWAVFEVSPV